MTKPIIKIMKLSYTYSAAMEPVLKDITLEICEGETVLITGKSGCGKSTLARCLNGLIPHFYKGKLKGEVSVNGMNPVTVPVWQMATSVGMVFQNSESQLFTLSIEEEISFGPENFALPREDILNRVEWALDAVGLKELRASPVFGLSDGQKQRLCIAANLSCLPQILIFDEPTSNLDWEARKNFITTLNELKKQWSKTIIIIEHRVYGLENLVDKVVMMENGRITKVSRSSILLDYENIRKIGLRSFNLGNNQLDDVGKSIYLRFDWHKGSSLQDSIEEKLIEFKDVDFHYERGFNLHNVNLAIYKGETVGIIGLNGAGKTTLLKLIAGLLKPYLGIVSVDGRGTRKASVRELAHSVALVLQNPDQQLFMSRVDKEISLSLRIMGFEGTDRDMEVMVEKVLCQMGILELKDRHPQTLSQGEKQRVTIASALIRQPKALLLDEPTSGMDGCHLDLLIEKLKELKNKSLSIVIASHDIELLLRLCDRILVLKSGRVYEYIGVRSQH